MIEFPDLPIRAVLPQLVRALHDHGRAVLQAPPGGGKTTLVPLELLDAPWRQQRKVIMLEPRRLAARAAATRMASLLGQQVGDVVGYAMRLERRIGPSTVIEVLTEGTYLRRLQADPGLDDVAAVLFDEFHERSLDADLALALTLDMRRALRPDLRLVVMSATLDGDAVARLLDDAPVIRSAGRMFPVTTRHLGRDPDETIDRAVATACLEATASESGSILAFLPGQAEIGRAAALLGGRLGDRRDIEIHPLYGDLSREAQDRAIQPAGPGVRKIVLATDIAETSLTIEGIRIVVDSGLARKPHFSPRTGTAALMTRRIALANADQRRGRAGRLEPGLCLRLWSAADERAMVPHLPPEIADTDLVPLVLELRVWGIVDPMDLAWLDPPPPAGIAAATRTLQSLGALDQEGGLTPLGRRMAKMPTHPRLAAMILQGDALDCLSTGIALAALLSARDILPASAGTDLADRLTALCEGGGNRARRSQVQEFARQLGRGRFRRDQIDAGRAGLLLSAGYPDRIAKRRGPGSYRLANGRGARIETTDPLSSKPWIVIADLDDRGADGQCRLAAELPIEELPVQFFQHVTHTRIDPQTSRVMARHVTMLGAIEVRATEMEPAPEEAAQILAEALAPLLPQLVQASAAAERLRCRVMMMRGLEDGRSIFPDLSDAGMVEDAPAILDGWLAGVRSLNAASTLDWHAILSARLDHATRARLDQQLPTHWTTPAGIRHAIDYSVDPPVLAVRLQEMFGADRGPVLAEGRIPCVMQLLSPAKRPAAITSDLAGFWKNGWIATKKELKGRYPRHFWPDDPATAAPTSKLRPKPT